MIDLGVLEATLSEFTADAIRNDQGEVIIPVKPDRCLALLTMLRDEPAVAMRRLLDLSVVDREARSPKRFLLVYALDSPTLGHRFRVEVELDLEEAEAGEVDSVTGVWPVAGWLEREAFDLFGIHFRGHPDLRRLLLDEAFDGHPLRKDHPRDRRPALGEGERAR